MDQFLFYGLNLNILRLNGHGPHFSLFDAQHTVLLRYKRCKHVWLPRYTSTSARQQRLPAQRYNNHLVPDKKTFKFAMDETTALGTVEWLRDLPLDQQIHRLNAEIAHVQEELDKASEPDINIKIKKCVSILMDLKVAKARAEGRAKGMAEGMAEGKAKGRAEVERTLGKGMTLC